MSERQAEPKSAHPSKSWQKTLVANLIRYVPLGIYYARLRVGGKLVRKTLNTDVLSVAKLRLTDFERQERQRAESGGAAARGKMTLAHTIGMHRQRVAGDTSLKPRAKDYHGRRITAQLKTWTGLDKREIRSPTKADCLNELGQRLLIGTDQHQRNLMSSARHGDTRL